ncbi:hypothetical protein [Variovorax sp.]|uniref:hypothetical protein n=1 Tax=Variovorax sp. TaxID=1871043 RepID=UPI0037D9D97E
MDFFAPDIKGVVDLFLTAFTSAHSPEMHNALAIRAAHYTTPTGPGSRAIAPMLDDPASRKRPSKRDKKRIGNSRAIPTAAPFLRIRHPALKPKSGR